MKANKEMALFTVLTGSRLYGTHTKKSDFDYKAVVLPPLDVLLMNTKVSNRKEKPVGKSQSDKMLAGEVETEYLPLQVFLDDFYAGQTYALEIVSAVLQHRRSGKLADIVTVNANSDYVDLVLGMLEELHTRFLNNNVKKMVGYAVSQSQKYGLKTQRYTSLKNAVEFLRAYPNKQDPIGKDPSVEATLIAIDHVLPSTVVTGKDGTVHAPALDVCGKKFPVTNKVETMLDSLEGLLATYGERVKSFDGEEVDWKALSHAHRITDQILELTTRGTLMFPAKNAAYLAELKKGNVELEVAMKNLETSFNKIDAAVANSQLPTRDAKMDKDYHDWKLEILRGLYQVELHQV